MAGNKTFLDFLNAADRKKIREHSKSLKFSDRTRILQRGRVNTTIYVIVRGNVKVIPRQGGRDMTPILLTAGNVIGEMSFIDKDKVSADVIAAGDVHVKVLDTDIVAQFILQDPFFFGRFYKALARTLSFRLRSEGGRSADSVGKRKDKENDWDMVDYDKK